MQQKNIYRMKNKINKLLKNIYKTSKNVSKKTHKTLNDNKSITISKSDNCKIVNEKMLNWTLKEH